MYTLQDVGPYKNVNGNSVLMDESERQAILGEWNANLANRVPKQVYMRQARTALLNAGLLDAVDSAIASMNGAAGKKARIEWEFSQVVQRDWPLVNSLAPVLGLTSQQIDQLFIEASSL